MRSAESFVGEKGYKVLPLSFCGFDSVKQMSELNEDGIAVASAGCGCDPRCLPILTLEKCTFVYFYYERVGFGSVTDSFHL